VPGLGPARTGRGPPIANLGPALGRAGLGLGPARLSGGSGHARATAGCVRVGCQADLAPLAPLYGWTKTLLSFDYHIIIRAGPVDAPIWMDKDPTIFWLPYNNSYVIQLEIWKRELIYPLESF